MSTIIFILSIITIIFAFYALEAEDRLHSIVSIGLATISTGAIFLFLGAIYVAVFHLVVYSGVMTVLFAAVAHFLPEDEVTSQEDENED
ncbi:MAG: NADH-quinone oxidoreductase subunit J [Candidatus Heimdallarchaeota archaeon]|nr:NADH-quinone oxidoreductase subunit J [Candidatus Heimdallarchaeota archaeon]